MAASVLKQPFLYPLHQYPRTNARQCLWCHLEIVGDISKRRPEHYLRIQITQSLIAIGS